jgi:hypothetical protein
MREDREQPENEISHPGDPDAWVEGRSSFHDPIASRGVWVAATIRSQETRSVVWVAISAGGAEPMYLRVEEYFGTALRITRKAHAAVVFVVERLMGYDDEDDDRSQAEHEYELAKSAGVPVLVYFPAESPGDQDVYEFPEAEALIRFKKRLADENLVVHYHSLEELDKRVKEDAGSAVAHDRQAPVRRD